MKHLKDFKSIFENQNDLDDQTRDLFDIWEVYKFRGPWIDYISDSYMESIDWEMGDLLDEPDVHVRVYSADGFGQNELEFQAEYEVTDDHYTELNLDNFEIADDHTIIKIIEDQISLKGYKFKTGKYRGYSISSSMGWNDFIEIFDLVTAYSGNSEIEIESKKYEADLILRYNIKKESDNKEAKIYYVRLKDGKEMLGIQSL